MLSNLIRSDNYDYFVNAFSELPQTHSRCQNFSAKSTHFSCPSVSLEAFWKVCWFQETSHPAERCTDHTGDGTFWESAGFEQQERSVREQSNGQDSNSQFSQCPCAIRNTEVCPKWVARSGLSSLPWTSKSSKWKWRDLFFSSFYLSFSPFTLNSRFAHLWTAPHLLDSMVY